jgi:hypothetical protein
LDSNHGIHSKKGRMSDSKPSIITPDTEAVEVGAVAVVDGDTLAVKRSLDMEVYAAEGQVAKRPTLSMEERTPITEAMEQSP